MKLYTILRHQWDEKNEKVLSTINFLFFKKLENARIMIGKLWSKDESVQGALYNKLISYEIQELKIEDQK